MKNVTVFTDGAARGNPGPGGWAFVYSDGQRVVEGGGGESHTTNNAMELAGAVGALSYIRSLAAVPAHVMVHTDSAYLVNGVTKWLSLWQENNWQTKTKTEVKNQDLWRKLSEVLEHLDTDIVWVRVSGHAGVPGNERVDEIATAYADKNKINLFSGSYKEYDRDLSITKSVAGTKSKKARKGEAFSYVSSLKGHIQIHKTWKECEARVKGTSGARFKKSLSKDDEGEIVKEFGGR